MLGKKGIASGFIVRPGLVLVAADALEGDLLSAIRISFPGNPSDASQTPTFIFAEPRLGLALVKVDTPAPELPLTLDTSTTEPRVTLIGAEGSGGLAHREGTIERVALGPARRGKLRFKIEPSWHGAPLLDAHSLVMGVALLDASTEGTAQVASVTEIQQLLQAYDALGEEERLRLSAGQSLETAIVLLHKVGQLHVKGMGMYVDAMDLAIRNGVSADYGLDLVRPKVLERLDAYEGPAFEELEREVKRLAGNAHVSNDVRERLADYWTTLRELKSYVDSPRGSFLTYRDKHLELGDKHDQQVAALAVLLDLELPEE